MNNSLKNSTYFKQKGSFMVTTSFRMYLKSRARGKVQNQQIIKNK